MGPHFIQVSMACVDLFKRIYVYREDMPSQRGRGNKKVKRGTRTVVVGNDEWIKDEDYKPRHLLQVGRPRGLNTVWCKPLII